MGSKSHPKPIPNHPQSAPKHIPTCPPNHENVSLREPKVILTCDICFSTSHVCCVQTTPYICHTSAVWAPYVCCMGTIHLHAHHTSAVWTPCICCMDTIHVLCGHNTCAAWTPYMCCVDAKMEDFSASASFNRWCLGARRCMSHNKPQYSHTFYRVHPLVSRGTLANPILARYTFGEL